MAIVNGRGTTLQIGKESTWGTAASPSVALNYLSESLKLNADRKEEDTLVGGKTSRSQDIMKLSNDGDFQMIAKPGNIGLLLALALGVEGEAEEGDTGVYTHKFTPIAAGNANSLASFTAIIDRVIATKAYTGLKVNSLTFECEAGDYMKLTVNVSGKGEESGIVSSSLVVPSTKAFRFAGGTCTFDGVDFGEITSISIEYNNNLDDGEQTLGSGYYGTEQEPQDREINVTLESFYNSKTETIREQKYKVDGATTAVKLNFISPDTISGTSTNYALAFDMPLVCVNDCSPNVGGKEKISLTIGGKALESSTQEALTVTLTDGNSTTYSE